MNKLQKLCAAVILTAFFTLSAFAGDISMPGVMNRPPRPDLSTCEINCPSVPTDDDILSPDIVALDPVTEFTLNLLQSWLPLI